ncbi:MAG: alkaline phosphatase family protein [Fimbriimonadia bacterium]|jgi:hypothetical protein
MRLLGAWVLLLLAAGAWGPTEGEPTRNVILVGWDGAQRAHIQECLHRGELPTLARLSKEGALVNIDIEGVTDTKAGWSQILTGYSPEVTGVYSNRRFQPIPKGLTVFERLEQHFGPSRFVTVAVVGKMGNVDDGPPIKRPVRPNITPERRRQLLQGGGSIVNEGGKPYLVVPGKPYYNVSSTLDFWRNGLIEDDKVGELTLELLEKYRDRPFFFFVHFASVDHNGHKFGENSKQYNDALISNDRWTGRILAKLRKLGIYDKTIVYVTADHGFDEGQKTHRNAPYVTLATNDPRGLVPGKRVDVAPTILDAFGLDLASFHPRLDGKSLIREKGAVAEPSRPRKKP